ncbi:Arachidonate 15-lipoxygenase precursor [Enhygromyxa salina]|uniref:Arachidonate 15-lipoxygenase n=2 Tax=Enhygromyxa salina TaxID=215803 RepID=A0A0C2CQ24_9BACT|nr:Arachidonate 15-lipoxygenase precursor [Enhygromyxa salina]
MDEWWHVYAFMSMLPPGTDDIGAVRSFQLSSNKKTYEEKLVSRDDSEHSLRYDLVSVKPETPTLEGITTVVSMKAISDQVTEVTWCSWVEASRKTLASIKRLLEPGYESGIAALDHYLNPSGEPKLGTLSVKRTNGQSQLGLAAQQQHAQPVEGMAEIIATVMHPVKAIAGTMTVAETNPWEYDSYPVSPMPRMVKGLPRSQALSPAKVSRMVERLLEYGFSQFDMPKRKAAYPADSLDQYAAYFGGYVTPPTYTLEHWDDDTELCRQLTQGVNPMLISVVGSIEQVPKAMRSLSAQDKSIDELIADKRLFIVDYKELAGLELEPPAVFYAPIMLVYKELLEGGATRLNVVAIQLERDDGPIYTPNSATPNRYRFAKVHVACADNQVHQFIWHLGLAHLGIEPMAVAANNCLKGHPIGKLLLPHFKDTIGINFLARQTLIAETHAITAKTFSIGTQQGVEIVSKAWADYDFFGASFPEQLRARGFDRERSDDLDDYCFRDDGFLIWDALGNYTKNMVDTLYKDDAAVAADPVIQAWAKESSSPEQANIAGFPSTIASAQLLADCLRVIIWTASAMHSTLNYPQYPYTATPLNRAAALFLPMPPGDADIDEKVLLAAMPSGRIAIFQGLLSWLLSTESDSTLLGLDSVGSDYPKVHAAFQAELAQITTKIDARNKKLTDAGLPSYGYLLPANIATSINI